MKDFWMKEISQRFNVLADAEKTDDVDGKVSFRIYCSVT